MKRSLFLRNPRTGEREEQIPVFGNTRIARLSRELRGAQPHWEALGVERRSRCIAAWSDTLENMSDSLVSVLERDTGRRTLARLEMQLMLQRMRHWSQCAPELLKTSQGRSEIMPDVGWEHMLCPYPLVGVISPWNFPMMLGMFDLVPAIAAGSAVLLKPSEVTSRFVEPLRESLHKHPELSSVVKIVTGDRVTGTALLRQVDAVCFTGSIETGRKVAQAAARRLIPAFLELGGKDPAIILASADLGQAVRAVLRGAVASNGQSCQSIERIYVEREIAPQFISQLTEAAREVHLNYPDPGTGHSGPFIFGGQADTVAAHLEDAVRKGAVVHCGGEVQTLGGGRWCLPTVLSEVDHQMRVMCEESFGPLLPVMCFDTVEEALRLANDSRYGLSGAVFAGSVHEARAVAGRLNVGAVSINDAALTTRIDDVEKDAFGESGLGLPRMGDAGLLRMLRKKALLIQNGSVSGMEALREDAAPF